LSVSPGIATPPGHLLTCSAVLSALQHIPFLYYAVNLSLFLSLSPLPPSLSLPLSFHIPPSLITSQAANLLVLLSLSQQSKHSWCLHFWALSLSSSPCLPVSCPLSLSLSLCARRVNMCGAYISGLSLSRRLPVSLSPVLSLSLSLSAMVNISRSQTL